MQNSFKSLEELKEVVKTLGDPETNEDVTAEPEEITDLRHHLSFEQWEDFCKAWLEASGFHYDEEKGTWIDDENGGEEVGDDPSSVVAHGGYEGDVLEWAQGENLDEYQQALRDWAEEERRSILSSKKANEIFAKEAAKRWNHDYDEVLANLETDGRLGWKIRYALLDWENSLFDMEDPETGEWLVPKMLGVSHARHTLTDYDNIDKRGMDEFEVDELRKAANRQVR